MSETETNGFIVPPGWKFVPIEPTGAMRNICAEWEDFSYDGCLEFYAAMISAAPTHPQG